LRAELINIPTMKLNFFLGRKIRKEKAQPPIGEEGKNPREIVCHPTNYEKGYISYYYITRRVHVV